MKQKKFENDDDVFSSISSLLTGESKKSVGPKLDYNKALPLRRAPNAIVFIESENYLCGEKLYPIQFKVIRDFFELLCPSPFCNDIENIENIKREDQILLEYNKCPKCGFYKYDALDQFKWHNELIGIMGMRSGKSMLVAYIVSYITHEFLCLGAPQKKLGIMRNQIIEGAFVATSREQVQKTVWANFKQLYENSKWFQDLKIALMNLELSERDLRRGNLYRETEKLIEFKFKNLLLSSLHSNSSGLAGSTRLFAIIDEISRFDTSEAKQGGEEVYRVLKNSLMTVQVAVSKLRKQGQLECTLDAFMLCVSSPIHLEDKGMKLLEESKVKKRTIAFRYATWEANPTITREDLADEFASDPVRIERDFGARPPGAQNALVKDPNIIEACIDKKRMNMLIYRERFFNKEIRNMIFNYIGVDLINLLGWKNLASYTIHLDAGKFNDSFCLAISHLEDNIVIVDGALELRPIPKGRATPREVFFPDVTSLIFELNKKITIESVTYDRWNSAEQIDTLRDAGILAVGKNLDRDDHIMFVNSMTMNLISFPARERENINPSHSRNTPCAKALYELLRLEDSGLKVDHGSYAGASNDLIQCYVGCHRSLKYPEKAFGRKDVVRQLNAKNDVYGKKPKGVGKVITLRR